LASCGRLADKGIVQSGHAVATDPPLALVNGVARHRYTRLFCRYPNSLDSSRLTEPAHRNGSSFKGIQTALLEILGMIKAHSAEY
jgi:hypothetical protein